MPLYDFECDACGERFEQRIGFDDAAPACPSCGSPNTRRVLSGFAIGQSFLRPTGGDAKRLDAQRAARETQRLERKEQRRQQRAQREGS
jgi:putative FmdB family regulatory protein